MSFLFVVSGIRFIILQKYVRTIDVVNFAIFVFYALPPIYTPEWFAWVHYPEMKSLISTNQVFYSSVVIFAHVLATFGYKCVVSPGAIRINTSYSAGFPWFVILINLIGIALVLATIPDIRILAVFAENHQRSALLGISLELLDSYFSTWNFWFYAGPMAALMLFVYSDKKAYQGLAVAFILFWSMLFGRRGLFLGWVFLIFLGLFHKRKINVISLVVVSVLAVVFMFGYLQFGRGLDNQTFIRFAAGDLGRQRTLLFTLQHADIMRNEIMPYPGYSYAFVSTFWIPRSLWENKPIAGNRAYTQFLLGLPQGYQTLPHYNEEFGFIDESIMNFGYMGVGLYPFYGMLFGLLERYRRRVGLAGLVMLWFAFYLTVFSMGVVIPMAVYGMGTFWLLRKLFIKEKSARGIQMAV